MNTKTTILYDPQMFDIQDYGGISRYFANLISGVNSTNNFKATIPLLYSSNYYLRDVPQIFNNKIGRTLLRKYRRRAKWNQIYAKQQIKKSNFDLLHATYYNPYFLENLKKPLVITIHDMIYENYPDLFPEAAQVIAQKKLMIESASSIITISEFTKKQLFKFYPNLSIPVKVVYHGIPDVRITETKEKLPKKYLLYVGDRFAEYKNFKFFIEAIAPFLKMEKDLFLICAGGSPFRFNEYTLFEGFGVSNSIIQLNASDALLKQLYRQALLFIYPSLEEGFGLPLLEAFSNGCMIACANCSCFPEVGGKAVSYFDPLNLHSIRYTIQESIENPELRMAKINFGYEQLKKFSFTKSLNETLDIYNLTLK